MKKNGFTLIEVAIVMVVLGLILGLGIPMMKMLMKQNKLTENRTAVKEAKDALIGYAYANGKFPTQKSGYLLPYTIIGTRHTDAYGNQLLYDVNSHLIGTTDINSFCQAAKTLSQNDTTSPGSVGRPIVNGHSVAFVVLSKGSDYKLDSANNITHGVYENPSHPYNEQNSNDIVVSYSLSELMSWCKDVLASSSSGGSSSGVYSSDYAKLSQQVADIVENFPNNPPKSSDLNLPPGFSYSKQGKRGILRYQGKKAVIRYNHGSVKRINIR